MRSGELLGLREGEALGDGDGVKLGDSEGGVLGTCVTPGVGNPVWYSSSQASRAHCRPRRAQEMTPSSQAPGASPSFAFMRACHHRLGLERARAVNCETST
jgi:hypothetical protein